MKFKPLLQILIFSFIIVPDLNFYLPRHLIMKYFLRK